MCSAANYVASAKRISTLANIACYSFAGVDIMLMRNEYDILVALHKTRDVYAEVAIAIGS